MATEDIYNGNYLTVWKDEETVFLGFPYCCINIPIEEYSALMSDLKELVKKWLSNELEYLLRQERGKD